VNKPRLRILRVVTRLNVGGPALHVCLLTARLDPNRFDSLLAAGSPGADEGDMLELRPELRSELGDRFVSIPGLGRDPKPASDLRALSHLRRLVREFKPHIVHTHMAKAGTLGRLVAWTKRVPVRVHTFHGTVFEGHFNPWVGRLISSWERQLARITDPIVAVSPAVASDLQRRGIPSAKVRVVPLGLDLARFRGVPALRSPVPHTVCLIARLVTVKDVPLFFEATAFARQHLPDLQAIVVGDGPLRNDLERAAPSWASVLGNRADLPEIIESCGAIVLTSRSEGSPVALIEALAAGRPVVSVPVGGVVDILTNRPGAVLASDRSAASIAEGIVRGLTDRSYAVRAEEGRSAVIAEFGADRLVGDIESLYEELWDRHLQRVSAG
jgi:glycosyltransferase involved in cell wall biosynthesis